MASSIGGLGWGDREGVSLREWAWESFERRWDRGESLREWVESDTKRHGENKRIKKNIYYFNSAKNNYFFIFSF